MTVGGSVLQIIFINCIETSAFLYARKLRERFSEILFNLSLTVASVWRIENMHFLDHPIIV